MDNLPEGYTLDQPASQESAAAPAAAPEASDELPQGFKLDQPASPSPDELPEGFQLDSEKYGTTEQQVKTGLEGAAQGFLSKPAAIFAEEHLLGVNPEDIAGREQTNPGIHGITEASGLGVGLLTGAGEAAGVANIAEHLLPEATTVGMKIGAGVLKGAIDSGIFQAQDDVGNYMLGKGGDPSTIASSIVAAGALGAITGGIFSSSSAALKKLGEEGVGEKAKSFLLGMGHASEHIDLSDQIGEVGHYAEAPGLDQKSYQQGVKFFNESLPKAVKSGAKQIAEARTILSAASHYGIGGVIVAQNAAKKIVPYIEKILSKPISYVGRKYGLPAVLKLMSAGDTTGLFDALNLGDTVGSGLQKINSGIEGLFQAGSQQAVDATFREADSNKLKDYIQNGTLDQEIQNQQNQSAPQAFAEGGEIPKPIEYTNTPILKGTEALAQYPDQAALYGNMRGRVNTYLNSIRPQQNQAVAPFDDQPDNREAQRTYDKAIKYAIHPLSILNEVKDGSLTPESLNHFKNLYPEMHDTLMNKISQKIVESKLNDDKKVPYRTRQGMSLFMGTPLDSTLTQQNIAAAQSAYLNLAQEPAPNAPVTKNKRNTSKLGDSAKQFQTAGQAAQSRLIEDR